MSDPNAPQDPTVLPPDAPVAPTAPTAPPAAPEAPTLAAPPAPGYSAPAAPAAPAAPGYAAPGQPVYATAPAAVPGKTLGIVALVLSFLGGFSIIGLILGFVAKSQSKKAGVSNTPAQIAIIVGFIVLAISIIVGIILAVTTASLLSQCAGLPPGVYELDNGGTITCNMG